MSNNAQAHACMARLSRVADLVMRAQYRALILLQDADNQKRELDNRELAIIEKTAAALSPEVESQLKLTVNTDGEISDGAQGFTDTMGRTGVSEA